MSRVSFDETTSMRASPLGAAQSTAFGAASTRRLSKRDLRELVRLTGALQVTSAPAFERFGVVVHLPANHHQDEQRRPPAAQGATGGAASPQHADGVGKGTGRLARHQRRYGRGQQAAQQRKGSKKSNPLECSSGCTQEVSADEPSAAASARRTSSFICATSKAETEAACSTADASSAGSAGQQLQPQQPPACTSMVPRAVKLQQQQKRGGGVDGKRGPSTPSGESAASPSRPEPKRAHVVKALVHELGSDPCCDSVTGRKPELLGSALNSKAEPSSIACCSQDLESDSDREMDSGDEYQRILDAMKAASEGNEEAHSFLFQRYHSDQMPPDLKRLMEELIDNG
jgi:hypothetical protein